MENNFKHNIIIGDLDYVLATNLGDIKSKAHTLEYFPRHLPMMQNESGASTINTLYALNQTLESIKEYKRQNNDIIEETCYIVIPDKLFDSIIKGSYKNWIKNDGVASSGKVYSQKEMNQWIRFSSLYSDLFQDVNFRNLKYYAMANPRYDINTVLRYKYLISAMNTRIQTHKEKIAEALIMSL